MRPKVAAPIFALLVSLLAGCAGSDGGPTVTLYRGPAPTEETAAAVSKPAPAPRPSHEAVANGESNYSVRKGDNLYLIARRFGVPIRDLIEANALVPPYRLEPGQTLAIPQASTHVVARGETLYSIARKHQVARHEIVRLNNLGPPYTITPGQTLYLPARSEPARPLQLASRPATPAAQAKEPPANAAPDRTAAPAPKGITAETLAPPRPPAKSAVDTGRAEPAAAKPQPEQVARATGPRPPKRPTALPRTAIPKPPARSGSFLWPVRGRVISSFGPKAKGLHNDGINIAAPRGTPIKAAENGVVAYSGAELRGFGNLVLIRHADGYMTAYGHTDTLLVTRGQTVRRGQTIAKVGTSGAVSSPQLHFEIRKKKQALDPQRYLGG